MDLQAQDPSARLKALADFASEIKLESRIPIQRYALLEWHYCTYLTERLTYPCRYFRSGTEMLRMAEVYYKEGSIESAYTLYLKFLTWVNG